MHSEVELGVEGSAPEGETVVPVPGFGFLQGRIVKYTRSLFQDYLDSITDDISNYTRADFDQMKCESIFIPHWKHLFPELAKLPSKGVCPPIWDGASCIPPTLAGHTAVLPCMASAFGVDYSPEYNATKECFEDGSWNIRTEYNDCLCKATHMYYNTSDCDQGPGGSGLNTDIPINIHLAGYLLSFIALTSALCVYISLREMHCLRHKIHMGLFCAFGLHALNWILTLSWVDLVPDHSIGFLLCTTFALTYFFHLMCFYWMFQEGLYLFLQVQYPLSLVSIKYKHFLVFGVGGPIVNTLVWLILRLWDHDDTSLHGEEQCMFMKEKSYDRWVMQVPMLVILFWNTFFLIWIMSIVILKLRQNTALDHDRRHWKAAKALIVVMPILGVSHILTLVVKPTIASIDIPMAVEVFNSVEAVINSTQGFVISLPYCFLNGELRGVVNNRWKRWKMVRSVGRASINGTSVNTSSTLFVNHRCNLQVGCGLRNEEGVMKSRSKVFMDSLTSRGSRLFGQMKEDKDGEEEREEIIVDGDKVERFEESLEENKVNRNLLETSSFVVMERNSRC